MTDILVYKPPTTVKAFIKDIRPRQLFYDWIVGPVGSGKTTGIFFKLLHMAKLQAKSPDGIRRSRAVIVRNTAPQLKDTTLASWFTWFKDGQAGDWQATNKNFILRFDDVECEVLFRPLDTADDVARVLSLEVTFAIIDEFVQIPRAIVDALSARCGRYPSMKDGGATNWGMWGSSNTETEDNWWFTYLHETLPDNARFFKQPSGYSPDAENLENLPGGAAYYTEQAKGKSEAWIKQFIESEWGFSVAGKPVVSTFKPLLHLSKTPLLFNPLLPLVAGLDPGIRGTAFVFGQEDFRGRLLVLGELVGSDIGIKRYLTDYVKPLVRIKFKNAPLTVAPDPASANRSQTDERSVVDEIRKHKEFHVSIETNNRLAKRLDAIEHFTTRLTDEGPALLIDEKACPNLVRALKGGWRYVMNQKDEHRDTPEPEKNKYSHVGDGFGYLCRYFQRVTDRSARYSAAGVKPFVPPRTFGSSYHIR